MKIPSENFAAGSKTLAYKPQAYYKVVTMYKH